MAMEIQTPFGIFIADATPVDLGEVHTVLTREQMEEQVKTLQNAAREKAMGHYTYKLYIAVCIEALKNKECVKTGMVGWAYGDTDWRQPGALTAWPKLFINGVDCNYWIDIKEEYTGTSSWRSRPNGKIRVSVGSFGSRTSYPQKKDGTHNYAKIASRLVGLANAEIAKKRAEAQAARNAGGAEELRKELGLQEYWGTMRVNTSSRKDKPIKVGVEIKQEMTADEARALHAALKNLGYVK